MVAHTVELDMNHARGTEHARPLVQGHRHVKTIATPASLVVSVKQLRVHVALVKRNATEMARAIAQERTFKTGYVPEVRVLIAEDLLEQTSMYASVQLDLLYTRQKQTSLHS